MFNSKLYEALVNNYYPANNSTRVSTGGPKDPNNLFSKIILIILLILLSIVTYNLYFMHWYLKG